MYELQIEYVTQKIDKILVQLKSLEPTRMERGLINGLGTIIKSITGNLDHSDAVSFNNAIQLSRNNENKLVSELNSHISLNKEWMSQFSSTLTKLIDNQSRLNSTMELLIDSNAFRESSLIKYAKFAQLLDIISRNTEDLMDELFRIENSLAFIRASTTHHSMIDIGVLKIMLDVMKKTYNNNQVLDLELREYYDIIKPGYYYTEKKIVIIFRFPVFSNIIFNLYKLSIVPNKNHQALIPSYPFIATSEMTFVYMEAECPKVRNWFLCEKGTHHQVRTKPDCIQQLIINQALQESCRFTNVSISREAMEKLDDQHYVLYLPAPARVQLSCERDDFNSLQGSYLATIPPGCHLRTTAFTITNENNELKGQPLKLMKIPYDVEKQTVNSNHVTLNSISLKGLHDIQRKAMMETPMQLNLQQRDTLYHTTVPFYATLLSASALVIIIAYKRYKSRKVSLPTNSIERTDIYDVPTDQAEQSSHGRLPAKFSLNVLK